MAGSSFLEEFRTRVARTTLLDALKARQRHLDSRSLAREKHLPPCGLAIVSYETGDPQFLLLYGKGDGRRYCGPLGFVVAGERPMDAACRIAQEKLGLGKADTDCMLSQTSHFWEDGESHLFTMHLSLKRMREIADAVNSGKHPGFVLGCICGAEQLRESAPQLPETFRNALDSLAPLEKPGA